MTVEVGATRGGDDSDRAKPLVRRAVVEDAQRINEVRIASWKAAYGEIIPRSYLLGLDPADDYERRRGFLSNPLPGVVNWVSTTGDRVEGWSATGPVRDSELDADEVHELWALYVDPPCWRAGHGMALMERALLETAARGYEALVLWVLAENPIGRGFYERAGFRPDGAEGEYEIAGAKARRVRYRVELR